MATEAIRRAAATIRGELYVLQDEGQFQMPPNHHEADQRSYLADRLIRALHAEGLEIIIIHQLVERCATRAVVDGQPYACVARPPHEHHVLVADRSVHGD